MIRYTKDHEWVRLEGLEAVIGITDHAQAQLGDVVYVELPTLGTMFKAGDQCAVVESVKAASEVYAPLGGTVIAVNDALESSPGTVNESAEGEGWFARFRLDDPSAFDALLDRAAYDALIVE